MISLTCRDHVANRRTGKKHQLFSSTI